MVYLKMQRESLSGLSVQFCIGTNVLSLRPTHVYCLTLNLIGILPFICAVLQNFSVVKYLNFESDS